MAVSKPRRRALTTTEVGKQLAKPFLDRWRAARAKRKARRAGKGGA